MSDIEKIFERLMRVMGFRYEKEIADALGLSPRALAGRKKGGSIEKELRALAQQRPELGIDVDYVLTGVFSSAVKPVADTRSPWADFGPRLHQIRVAEGDSVMEFSKRLNLSEDELLALESGSNPPPVDLLKRLAELYPNKNLAWLWGAPVPNIGELNHLEANLIANYRSCSAEGQEMLRRMAAQSAQWHQSRKGTGIA